jgi:hypothetical protein
MKPALPIDARSALLRRGGTSFALAAVAFARGTRNWHALSVSLAHPADEIRSVIEEHPGASALAAAADRSFSDSPGELPDWLDALTDDGLILLGDRVAPFWPPSGGAPLRGRDGGIAALAIAFCRRMDRIRAMGDRLPPEDARQLLRRARLAAVLLEPGAPSAMKRQIRALVEGGNLGTTHP